MKKHLSILVAAATAACVTSAFAQGTVVFNNGTGLVKIWTFSSNGTLINMPKGGGMVQLFWAPTGTAYTPWNISMTGAAFSAANPGWSLQDPTGFTLPAAGKFDGGTLTLQPLAAGGTIDYVVLGWTGAASSFDNALYGGALVGVSDKFTSATGNPTTIPPGDAVPLSSSFGGLILNIPEPSSLALTGVGATILLALRRREC